MTGPCEHKFFRLIKVMAHNCPSNAQFFSGHDFSKTFEELELILKRKIDETNKNKENNREKNLSFECKWCKEKMKRDPNPVKDVYQYHKKAIHLNLIQIKELAK